MRYGALARSVQMAGALERALQLSLQYANERVQFGRPIGKFQAVQHLLAQQASHAAAASAACDAALDASAGHPDPFLVAVAKARVSEAAGQGADIAHQVHGAMGFTREHSLHNVTRRLYAWRDEYGNEVWWQRWIGRRVSAQGADALWPMLTRCRRAREGSRSRGRPGERSGGQFQDLQDRGRIGKRPRIGRDPAVVHAQPRQFVEALGVTPTCDRRVGRPSSRTRRSTKPAASPSVAPIARATCVCASWFTTRL